MKTIGKISDLRKALNKIRLDEKTIGFVPTMGYLHEGHLSLIQQARKNNDFVVVSIFVNPTQFGPGEDLETYPRDLERDSQLCKEAGVDFIFAPAVEEMYDTDYSTYVDMTSDMTNKLCGASRPGHFRGVMSVVTKLFNIVQPTRAYFGRKDYQQVAVIKQMAKDLSMDVDIIDCPIIREKDGLAMSSRNTYLNEKERKDALVLSQSLKEAKKFIEEGCRDPQVIRQRILDKIQEVPYAIVDYVQVLDARTLKEINEIKQAVVIALAVKIGKPRLIDNIVVEVK